MKRPRHPDSLLAPRRRAPYPSPHRARRRGPKPAICVVGHPTFGDARLGRCGAGPDVQPQLGDGFSGDLSPTDQL